ncbi:MAG: DUF2752 domain-containing protein [Bacteroidetes bacterium]|nr:DUF2752 domain-containing protein [Bacteroidota bacterium]
MNIRQILSESYNKINFIFTGIILLGFIYSGIFSANGIKHPIKFRCAEIYNKPCVSTGLSRSFSEIVRLNFHKAKEYNSNGIAIFLFFFIQFFLRIIVSFIYISKIISEKKLILLDVGISIILFIFTFHNLIFWGINPQ